MHQSTESADRFCVKLQFKCDIHKTQDTKLNKGRELLIIINT